MNPVEDERDEREDGSQGGRGLRRGSWRSVLETYGLLACGKADMRREMRTLCDVPRVLSDRRARRLLGLHTVEISALMHIAKDSEVS